MWRIVLARATFAFFRFINRTCFSCRVAHHVRKTEPNCAQRELRVWFADLEPPTLCPRPVVSQASTAVGGALIWSAPTRRRFLSPAEQSGDKSPHSKLGHHLAINAGTTMNVWHGHRRHFVFRVAPQKVAWACRLWYSRSGQLSVQGTSAALRNLGRCFFVMGKCYEGGLDVLSTMCV